MAARTERLYAGLDPDDLAAADRVLAEVTERARRLAEGAPDAQDGED